VSIIDRVQSRHPGRFGSYYTEDGKGRVRANLDERGNDTDFDRCAGRGARCAECSPQRDELRTAVAARQLLTAQVSPLALRNTVEPLLARARRLSAAAAPFPPLFDPFTAAATAAA
jgi:hypothetical protein